MTYGPKVRRQAARLGVKLPEGEPTREDSFGVWSSGGNDSLYEGVGAGECRVTRLPDGVWNVTLIGSKSRRGEAVGSFRTLDEAKAMVRFLQTKSGRRTWRGRKPRTPQEPKATRSEAALADLLARTNGGAVRVRVS
jgi:hypothetical protein